MHRGCRSHLLPTTCLWLILMLKEPHFKILQNSTYKLMLLCVVSHDASTSYIKYMFQKEMESSQEFSPETCALYSMLWKLHNKESNKIFAILSTRRLYYKIYNGLWPLVLLFHHWTLPPASMESSARLVLLISTASGLWKEPLWIELRRLMYVGCTWLSPSGSPMCRKYAWGHNPDRWKRWNY